MSKDEYLSPRMTQSGFDTSRSTSPIPNINLKQDNDNILSNSLDIKRQLSQSLGNAGGNSGSHGGINKPQSRRSSIVPIRSNDASENDDNDRNGDDDDDQGNERKRRDNINDKIQELLLLVPKEFFQEAPGSMLKETEEDLAVKNSGTKDGKPNKGQILTKSVEYIQYLQNLIDENNRKEVEMLMKLRKLEMKPNDGQPMPHTSAERTLGEIGVGPLSTHYFKKILVNSANSNKASQRRGSTS